MPDDLPDTKPSYLSWLDSYILIHVPSYTHTHTRDISVSRSMLDTVVSQLEVSGSIVRHVSYVLYDTTLPIYPGLRRHYEDSTDSSCILVYSYVLQIRMRSCIEYSNAKFSFVACVGTVMV